MKTYLFLCLLLLSNSLLGRSLDKAFRLLPQPQAMTVYAGKGVNYGELTFVIGEEGTKVPVLGNIVSALPQCKQNGKGVHFRLSESHVSDSPEGYILEVTGNGVTITARSEAGLFYGAQTLEQLLEDSRDFRKEIPPLKITDYPAIPYRAIHLDTKHHLDRMEYYYRMVDKLARYKVNAIIWELEDKLRYTRRPEVASPNAISKQEMEALCRYAKERNVEIDPLVQGLGHAGFILKHHWELRENPASDWEFCPAEPRTYEIQFDLYLDALEAMPYGKYLHIGGDEITAIGIDQRCKVTGKSAFELQMIWLKNVCSFAVEHGRTPIFWDDMPLKYSGLWNIINSNMTEEEIDKIWNTDKLDEAIDLFPKECVYMRWKYEDALTPGNRKIVDWYHRKGLRVMGATAASAGDSPFLPRENTRAYHVQGFNRLIADNQLEGILATAWDDGSPHLETVWRGFIAQAEYGWNPHTRTIPQFNEAHAQREFGFNPADSLLSFLAPLEQAAFFFDGALVTAGRRNPAWGTQGFTLLNLPDKNHPGEWNKKHAGKIDQAREAIRQYEQMKADIQKAEQHARRNRYTLQVYEQTNNLLVYPSLLILALAKYDNAHGAERETALREVDAVCRQFDNMRRELEAVYSETRFMSQPEGYIADLNHHNHLASKTNSSDWLFFYELPMVEKTRRWITGEAEVQSYRLF